MMSPVGDSVLVATSPDDLDTRTIAESSHHELDGPGIARRIAGPRGVSVRRSTDFAIGVRDRGLKIY